jgi:hypothetical protein
MALEIPITSDGGQSFRATVEGSTYDFFISYNSRMNVWYMDIGLNNVELITGIALLGGVDVISHYAINLKYLYAINIDNPRLDAESDNLGEEVLLIKLMPEEVESIG